MCFFPFSSSLRKYDANNASAINAVKTYIGSGCFYWLIRKLVEAIDLPTKLQIPMAVVANKVGKMRAFAQYTTLKPKEIPNLVTKKIMKNMIES